VNSTLDISPLSSASAPLLAKANKDCDDHCEGLSKMGTYVPILQAFIDHKLRLSAWSFSCAYGAHYKCVL